MNTSASWYTLLAVSGVTAAILALHKYGLAKLLRWMAVYALSVAEGLESYRVARLDARRHWSDRLIGHVETKPCGFLNIRRPDVEAQ